MRDTDSPPEFSHLDFWDVGQGDCTTLTFDDGSIVIVDVGGRGSPLVDWLRHQRPQPRVRALVLTHSHADHCGALNAVLDACNDQIEGIWMLRDRPTGNPVFLRMLARAERCAKKSAFQIRRLEDGSLPLFTTPARVQLRAIFPHFSVNETTAGINETAGVLELSQAGRVLAILPSDVPLERFVDLAEGAPPFAHTGPHHGGPTSRYRSGRYLQTQLNRIQPTRSFISVGTLNPYSHPRPSYLHRLAGTGSVVTCSQLTRHCAGYRATDPKPVFPLHTLLQMPPPRSGVSCRGPLRLHFDGARLIPDKWDDEHRRRIQSLRRPCCVKGLRPQVTG